MNSAFVWYLSKKKENVNTEKKEMKTLNPFPFHRRVPQSITDSYQSVSVKGAGLKIEDSVFLYISFGNLYSLTPPQWKHSVNKEKGRLL